MSTPLITIFVRHRAGCKYDGDEFARRCQCKKHLRWTRNGTQCRRTANSRTWAEAEEAKRDLEDQLSGRPTAKTEAKTLDEAARSFLQAKEAEGIAAKGRARYTRDIGRLRGYCERRGVFTIEGVTRELLTGYMARLETSSGTKALTVKTIKCFLRYCYEAQWLARIPGMPKIAVTSAPTEPLTTEEYAALLDAAGGPKLRALIQLMRHSGLAIRDAVTLERAEIQQTTAGFYRVTTSRQKTGTHVSVPMPAAIAEEILAVANENPAFIFWHGKGDGHNFSVGYGARMAEAFDRAGIADVCFMKSHRLRDTFAVALLEKGVPMEEVSKLLGHETIRTTEKHYSRWVKSRQDRLDSLVTATWAA